MTNHKNTHILDSLPDDWSILTIEEIVLKEKGSIKIGPFGSQLKKEEFVKKGIKVYDQETAIRNNFFNGGNFITKEKFETLKSCEVKPGDLIISMMGTIGASAVVPSDAPKGILNSHLLRVRPNQSLISNKFLKILISDSLAVINQIKKHSQGGIMSGLSAGIIKGIKLLIPPLPEQKAIAHVLSLMDTAINKNNQLIAYKELRKKWLMQNLLTGKKRLKGFSGEWKEYHLRDMFIERNENNNNGLTLLSIGQNGVYPQSESDKKDTSNENKSKYKRICPGDIGYNTMRMWQGRSALSGLEGIVSPAYTIVTPKQNADSIFFSYLFKTPKLMNLFWRNSQGLVDDTLNCKFKDFSIVKVHLPEKEEQAAIAKVLQSVDKEMQLLKTKTEKLKEQKKWMMQVLLTGKKRLNVNY